MPVKIRLQRHGKKGKPFYWLVAADSRAKRDGKYLEKLGTYDPNTNPADVKIDLNKSIVWLEKGAQPTNTARALLSYRGVLLKHHLNKGIKKGALTEEEAEKRFLKWLDEKEKKIENKVNKIKKSLSDKKDQALEAEKITREKRAEAVRIAKEKELKELEAKEEAAEEKPAEEQTQAKEEAAEEKPAEEQTQAKEEAAEEKPAEDQSENKDESSKEESENSKD
ncbi:MAG: 30S ribosomal protein S16 [Flavobacteriaceae bacterium]|nr:30S ribosomal protein S16 [Flavobacteriaceae bacterium]